MSERYRIMVGVPSGGAIYEGCTDVGWLASLKHDVIRQASTTEGLNFNMLLATALHGGLNGQYTHAAITHTDIRVVEEEVGLRWADRLIEEMETHKVSFISVPNAIKDVRGLTSSGIGDPTDPWHPFRRFTTQELLDMPRTFTAENVGYGDKYLLHNEALSMIDLRDPLWYQTDENGRTLVDFNVTEAIVLENGGKPMCWGSGGSAKKDQDTEDWRWSYCLWKQGIKTALTTRIELLHRGWNWWSNKSDCLMYKDGDRDTISKWRPSPETGIVGS